MLIDRWETLEGRAENLQRMRSLQREMSTFRNQLLELSSRVDALKQDLNDQDQLERRIQLIKVSESFTVNILELCITLVKYGVWRPGGLGNKRKCKVIVGYLAKNLDVFISSMSRFMERLRDCVDINSESEFLPKAHSQLICGSGLLRDVSFVS